MRLVASAVVGVASAGLLIVACSGGSGSVGLYGDTDGATDGPTGTDSPTNVDSGPGPGGACPTQPPAQGSSCTTAGLSCEWGGTGPGLLCTTNATCNGSASALKWFVNAPASGCVPDQAHNPPACPPSFGAPANGAVCPGGATQGTGCVYAEGLCGCTSCAGDAGQSSQWTCAAYPKPTGCPATRPLIGSACSMENQQCVYGGPCSVLSSLPRLVCTNGVWTRELVPVACANPVCGTK